MSRARSLCLFHLYLFLIMLLSFKFTQARARLIPPALSLPWTRRALRSGTRTINNGGRMSWTSPHRPPLIPTSHVLFSRKKSQLMSHSSRFFSETNSIKPKKTVEGNIKLLPEFFNSVHMKDFTKAKELFDMINVVPVRPMTKRKNMLTAMLSLCENADQLEYAQKLRNDLNSEGFKATESDFLPLIRCACDKGDIGLAKSYIEEIVKGDFIVRHRDTLPILQATVASGSTVKTSYDALDECFNMKKYNLCPRSLELELVLASGVQTGAIKEEVFLSKISTLLSTMNSTYCAIDHVSALRLHQAVLDGTIASEDSKSINLITKVFQEGILVAKPDDITGQILSSDLTLGKIVALRAAPVGHSEEELELLRLESQQLLEKQGKKKKRRRENDRARQFRPEPATVERIWTQVPELSLLAEKYGVSEDSIDLYDIQGKTANPDPRVFAEVKLPMRTHVNRDGIGDITRDHHSVATAISPHDIANLTVVPPSKINYFFPKERVRDNISENAVAMSGEMHSTAASCRLVEMSPTTPICPNCGDALQPVFMNGKDMSLVKKTLKNLITSASKSAAAKLELFDKWLRDQDDFDFVIDAANVAYYNQNFKKGKFSYQQIELVYNALKKSKITPNPRVLVLIPDAYLQHHRHNSVTGKRTITSPDDYRIISRLKEEGSFYNVPRHINDDWFVIYATLCGKRYDANISAKGHDWKPIYAVSNDMCRDHKLSFLSPRPFFRWRSAQVVFFDFKKSVFEGNAEKKQNVQLFLPGVASREFQQSLSKPSRWHLPIDDRQSWLCLNA